MKARGKLFIVINMSGSIHTQILPQIHNFKKGEAVQGTAICTFVQVGKLCPKLQHNHWLFCLSLDNLCPAREIPDGCVFEKSPDEEIISEAAGFWGMGFRLLSNMRGWRVWMLPECGQKIFSNNWAFLFLL